nr:nucleolar MIF4G domain-containing protein 1 homolog isoform X2 [Onthophagus taurus]
MSKVKSKTLNGSKSRKEIRKAGRKLKKQKKQEYYTNRKNVEKIKGNEPILDKNVDKNFKAQKQEFKEKPIQYDKFKEIQKDRIKQDKLKKEMSKQRNRQLQDANIEEDRNIKRLEKQLKLNKRKTKAIPKSFVSEGLDYLLEICDGEMKNAISAEQQFKEANDDFEEDFELMTGKKIKKQKVKKDDFDNFSDLEDDLQDSEDDLDDLQDSKDDLDDLQDSEDDLDDFEASLDDLQDSKDDLQDSEDKNLDDIDEINDDEENKSKIGTWEDIYGRLRSKDGSILNEESIKPSKYIPPALRKQDSLNDSQRKERLARLTKQLKGLLNRLAEANMHSISNQIEELYMANSRNDMNETITNLIVNSLATHVFTPERLLLEHVMLISILHANVGTEVGAHFLQEIVKLFDDLFNSPQEVEDKTLDNVVIIIAQLYNFKVFDAGLIYDILKKFAERFNEKSIECILLILKNVGFSLRKDDPLALKSLILNLQKEAAKLMEENKEK